MLLRLPHRTCFGFFFRAPGGFCVPSAFSWLVSNGIAQGVRFLLTMEKSIVNENIKFIDNYLQLQCELQLAIRRPTLLMTLKASMNEQTYLKKKSTLKGNLTSPPPHERSTLTRTLHPLTNTPLSHEHSVFS